MQAQRSSENASVHLTTVCSGSTAAYHANNAEPESLFERFHWLYAFWREYLFRDDTKRIAAALWSEGIPPTGAHLLEIGCGPGFYACRLAEHFKHLRVIGIDRSEQQILRAQTSARTRRLDNCQFEKADVRALEWPTETVDALVASRLFTILAERERALSEMHRVLRPGGRCFIAEPRSALRAAVPLRMMWMMAHLVSLWGARPVASYREPRRVAVLTGDEFGQLITSQPWQRVSRWQDAWYQYAVCEKERVRTGDRSQVSGDS